MQNILALALALFGAVHAAPTPQATYPADIQSSIQKVEIEILGVIADLAQERGASSDYSSTQQSLDALLSDITPSCPPVASPPPAANATQAIQYLQQTQLTLEILAEDIIKGDTASATIAICTAINQYGAVSSVIQSSSGSTLSPPPFTTTFSTSTSSSPTIVSPPPFTSTRPTIVSPPPFTSTRPTTVSPPPFTSSTSASTSSSPTKVSPPPFTSTRPTTVTPPPSGPTTSTNCDSQEDACRTAPNANQAFCSSQAAQCQTACSNSFDQCSTAPNANHAYCASVYAGCLGYNPFAGGSTVTPASTATTTVA